MPIYMKYEGIEGPTTGKYKGWIELESCQIGAFRNITGSTGNSNREPSAPSFSEIVVTKFQDSASQRLFAEALSGNGKKVTIDFVEKGGGAPYLSIELENVIISNYQISGNGDKPMESLSLNFTKVTYTTKATASAMDPKNTKDKAMWNTVVK